MQLRGEVLSFSSLAVMVLVCVWHKVSGTPETKPTTTTTGAALVSNLGEPVAPSLEPKTVVDTAYRHGGSLSHREHLHEHVRGGGYQQGSHGGRRSDGLKSVLEV